MKNESNSKLMEKQLLNEYKAGDFFLASPKTMILGKGCFCSVPQGIKSENQLEFLSQRVSAVLGSAKEQGHSRPIVVGAVPFDHEMDIQLIIPETIKLSSPLNFDYITPLESKMDSTYDIKSVPEPDEYIKGVEKGINYIRAGHLSKIVLSRSLHLTSTDKIDIHKLLHNLAHHNRLGYTFAVELPKERTLIGASPELLISRTGIHLMANPLAGSRPRSEDPTEDKRRADELLLSTKDLHEHEVVVTAVAAALRPYCKTLDVPEKPSLVQTEAMWHLSTIIKGEVESSLTTSLDLAIALHPTPAVCGSPTELAREVIREIEPFDRGFFTGMVGWCDENGDGEWIVTIRCAEVETHSLRLYAGAGVVSQSKAEEELAETTAKFRTMLTAMGLSQEVMDK